MTTTLASIIPPTTVTTGLQLHAFRTNNVTLHVIHGQSSN